MTRSALANNLIDVVFAVVMAASVAYTFFKVIEWWAG